MTNQPEQQEPQQEQEPQQAPAQEPETQPEEPQADALASEQEAQAQQEPAQEPEAPATEQDAQPDPKAQKLAAEAKRYRLSLRETEAQLETERARSNRLENALINQLADRAGVEHLETLRALGLTLAEITGPDGNLLPPAKAVEAIEKFAKKHGIEQKKPFPPNFAQTATPGPSGSSWADSFKIR